MPTSNDGGRSVVAVRQLRFRGTRDTDNSDSEDEEDEMASRWRGGVSAAATAGTRPTGTPQPMSLPTAAATTPASLPSRAGSSSSLELFTSSSSRSSSPDLPELPPDIRKSMTATATALKDRRGERWSGSSGNHGRVSGAHQLSPSIENRGGGDGNTAQTRQQLWGAGSTVRALVTSSTTHSAMEEEQQTVPGNTIAGDFSVVVEGTPTPSPTASGSLALRTGTVQPRSAATDDFKGKEASPPPAIECAAFPTSPASLSAGSAAGMPRPAALVTTTALRSCPASSSAPAPAPPITVRTRPTPTEFTSTVGAAASPDYRGDPSAAVESSRTGAGSVASLAGAPKAPLAALRSSSFLDDHPAVLAPMQIAGPTITGDSSGVAATATLGRSIGALTVPLTTVAGVDTPPPSSSPLQPIPSTTRPLSTAAARAATPAAISHALPCVLAAMPDSGRSGLADDSPVLSGPGSIVYNRVNAQGRGSVPSSVLEASSRPKRRALPGEHKTFSSCPAAVAQSAAVSAASPPLPGSTVSTQAVRATESGSAATRARPLATSQPFVNLLSRPHRQAPRLPGATHTRGGLSLIEDNDERQQCNSSLASASSMEQTRAETGRPDPVSVRGCGSSSSRTASPPSPPTQRAASSASDAPSSPLWRSAAATAAQRKREAALVIYDDRVPPAQRRAKRQAWPATSQTSATALTTPMLACVLRGLRFASSQDGKREDVLTCRPILRIGGGRGAAVRKNPVGGLCDRLPLDGRAADDEDSEGVDGSGNVTRGSLDNAAALHSFSGTPTEQHKYRGGNSGEDRSAKSAFHSASNYTVQRLLTDAQPQQKAGADSYIFGKDNGAPVPCVVGCLGRQGAATASSVKAVHWDISSGGPSSAALLPPEASRKAALSLLAQESAHVDLLNYRRPRRKQ
ncbi:hypothetical protein LtaPh_2415500 [Leishmania tarentolae]|uniref:Uncharacterized protein n=1 Tax=Leishmania tarentolae TaxID=5689 RepID=A0A640KI56_LEITA|nr:hypothetical protein LtaPh_2415500 [Leishmania tarentolae]